MLDLMVFNAISASGITEFSSVYERTVVYVMMRRRSLEAPCTGLFKGRQVLHLVESATSMFFLWVQLYRHWQPCLVKVSLRSAFRPSQCRFSDPQIVSMAFLSKFKAGIFPCLRVTKWLRRKALVSTLDSQQSSFLLPALELGKCRSGNTSRNSNLSSGRPFFPWKHRATQLKKETLDTGH